jgi:DNA ligase-1
MLDKLLYEGHDLDGLLYSPGIPVDSNKEILCAYNRHRKHGHEGTMVKVLTEPWTATRSHSWMKIKAEETLDLKIIGMKEGTGKYKGTCGAIIVDHKGIEVPVSGMSDTLRNKFWKERNSGNTIVGHTAEIEFQEVTVHGSLRHPRFKRVRDDKGE